MNDLQKIESFRTEEGCKRIYDGRYKTDVSSFDIYQFVEDAKKKVWAKEGLDESDAGRLIGLSPDKCSSSRFERFPIHSGR